MRFLAQEIVQANVKIERVSIKKLNGVISSQKRFLDKFGLGYTGGTSSSGSVTKEVKFIKAKEMLNNSHKQSVASLNPEPSLVLNHKDVLDQTMCVTTADFMGTLDQIFKS